MRKSEQLDKLAAALVKAQGEIEGARKDANNPFFKSRYANLESVVEASRPALVANGLAVSQGLGDGPNGPTLITTLIHSSGQWMEGEQPIMPKGGTNATPQDLGSAITYARRYGYAAMVGVIQVDDDAEGAMGRGGNSAGKQQGNTAVTAGSVASRTAQTQQAIKDKLNGKQETGGSQARKAEAGTAPGTYAQSEEEYQRSLDEVFGDSEPGRERRDSVHGGGTSSTGRAGPKQDQVQAGTARAGDGRGQENASAARQPSQSESGNRAPSRVRGEGSAPSGRLPGRSIPGGNGKNHSDASGKQNPASVNAPTSGPLHKPQGQKAASGDLQNEPGGGNTKPVPGRALPADRGASESGQAVKAIPKTEEEIAWFVNYMVTSLKEVEAIKQLEDLWLTNVVAVRSLPDWHKEDIVRAKDDAKARLGGK